MNYRLLSNGVNMPLLGLGTFPLNGDLLAEILANAITLGYSLFDTAWLYENEKVIGDTMRENGFARDKLFLTSKLHQNDLYLSIHGYRLLRKKSVTKAFRGSEKRLGGVDLYLLHAPFQGYLQMWESMTRLYEEGLVKSIGVSNFRTEHLQRIKRRGLMMPHVNQIEISPFNYDSDTIDFCNDHNVAVEAFSPFGRGILTEKILNNIELQRLADGYSKSVAQVILRWLTQQNIITIFRTRRLKNLMENSNIFDFSLAKQDMGKIESLDRGLCTVGGTIRTRG